MIDGGCLCGKIRYAIDGEITDVSHSHCSMCRKLHGAAFATYGAIGREQLRWLNGEEHLTVYRSSPAMTRTFCGRCGSPLICHTDEESDLEYVALGTVDGDPGCRPAYHIWVGSKAPWYAITDDLPRFDEWED